MEYLDLTLDTPALNLACDETLLDLAEAGHGGEVLRFWESEQPFVVLGYANKVQAEILPEARQVPILRRTTGGGSVVQGPGSLNYALILRLDEHDLRGIVPRINRLVLDRHREALAPILGDSLEVQGISDLAIGDRKISGNAVRLRKRFLLCHGTFLLDFEVPLVERLLAMPPREPDYRRGRSHEAFLRNTGMARESIKAALRVAWGATELLTTLPISRVAELARARYETDSWNLRR